MFPAFVDIDTMSNLMKFGFSTSKPIKEEKRKGLEKSKQEYEKNKRERGFYTKWKDDFPWIERYFICLLFILLVENCNCQTNGVEATQVQQTTDNLDIITESSRFEKDGQYSTAFIADKSVSQEAQTESLVIQPSVTVNSASTSTVFKGQTASQIDSTVQEPDRIDASESAKTSTSQIATDGKEAVTQSVPVDQLETPLKSETLSSNDKSLSLDEAKKEQREHVVIGEITGEDVLNVVKSLPEQPSGLHGTETTVQTVQHVAEALPGAMETPPETSTKKDADEKSEEEGLTFNEWTQKMLAKAEKDKLDSAKEENTGKPVISPSKQRKKNYASHDCGAKILTFNPESTNPKGILNSNKDDYMINPCKVKKWVIIELCEPIQALSVDIASLELFSSQPKMVRIYLSDRYPTKDWKLAGEQILKDERIIQSFDMRESHDYYAKYVKVELVDHYGDEHFCPLTILRVFGVAVTDYDPEEVESENMDEDIPVGGDIDENSKNLFDSARDTVMTLVNKVLNVDGEQESESNKTGNIEIVPGDGTANGTQDDNLNDTKPCPPNASIPQEKKEDSSGDQTSTGGGQNHPVVPEPGKTDSFSIVRKIEDDEQVETGSTLSDLDHTLSRNRTLAQMFVQCEWIKALSERLTKSKCRKISALCQFVCLVFRSVSQFSLQHYPREMPQFDQKRMVDEPLNTKNDHLSQTDSSGSSVSSVYSVEGLLRDQSVDLTQSEVTDRTSVDVGTLSEKSSHMESVQSVPSDGSQLPHSSTVLVLKPTLTQDTGTQTDSNVHSSVTTPTQKYKTNIDSKMAERLETQGTSTVQIDPSPTSSAAVISVTKTRQKQEPTPSLPDSWKPHTKDVMKTETQSSSEIKTPAKMSDKINSESTEEKTVPLDVSSTPNKIQSTSQSIVDTQVNSVSMISSDSSLIPDLLPTQTDPDSGPSQHPTVDVPKVSDNVGNLQVDPNVVLETQEVRKTDGKIVLPIEGKEELKTDETSANIKTEDVKVKTEKNLDIKLPMMSSTNRESALMRLSNRIKVLEQNVSLSSRFLEELSKRYKKQSEDMMKLLNRTLAKLSNMTVEHEVSNKIHDDEMYAMERRLENLTGSVVRLTHSLQTLNQQVTDRQMIATSIEILIIVFIFMVMNRWTRKQPLSPEVQKLIELMPSKPSRKLHHRRNSISGPATPSKKFAGNINLVGSLNKFPSETSLDVTVIEPSQSLIGNQKAFDGVKKKKKKRPKPLDGRGSTSGVDISTIRPSLIEESKKHGTNYNIDASATVFMPVRKKPENTANRSVIGGAFPKPDNTANRSAIGGAFPKKPPLHIGRKREDEFNASSPNTGRRDKTGHQRQKSLPKQHYLDEEFHEKALLESHIKQPCDELHLTNAGNNQKDTPFYPPLTHTLNSDCQPVKLVADSRFSDNSPKYCVKRHSLEKSKKQFVHDVHVFNNQYADKKQRDKLLDDEGRLSGIDNGGYKLTYWNKLVDNDVFFPETSPPTQSTQYLNGLNCNDTDNIHRDHQPTLLSDHSSTMCAMKEDNSSYSSDQVCHSNNNGFDCDELITDNEHTNTKESSDSINFHGLKKFWGLFK